MSTEASASHRVVRDTRLLLKTIRDEIADGRKPYSSDVRRLVDGSLALKFGEYVQFLERNGYVTLERKSDILSVTRTGRALIDGDAARVRGVLADARHHFGDRVDALGGDVAGAGVRLDNRFLRLDQIGRGSLGNVWRGRNLNVDRFVAIKLLDGLDEVVRPGLKAEVRRRFELAVRKHAQLVSPFVIQILDQNPSHTPPYVVMELATGGNLRDILNSGPLDPAVAIRFFVQIAHGLSAAHAEGLVHGDLKPENVLLDSQGNIKLSDFGFSRVIDAGQPSSGRAYVGYGSLGYMPPEMFRRRGAATPGADIYALGILLYEMLVGELPGRRSPMPTEVVQDLPKALDDLFDLMAQDDLRKRLGSVDEALELLWSAEPIEALLLTRSMPLFVESPVELRQLVPVPEIEHDVPGVESAAPSPSEGSRVESESFGPRDEVVTALNATDSATTPAKSASRPRSRSTRAITRDKGEEQQESDPEKGVDSTEFPQRRATDNWGIPGERNGAVDDADKERSWSDEGSSAKGKPATQTTDTLASGMPAQVIPKEDIFSDGEDPTGIEDYSANKERSTVVPPSGRRDESKRRKLEARLGKLDTEDG